MAHCGVRALSLAQTWPRGRPFLLMDAIAVVPPSRLLDPEKNSIVPSWSFNAMLCSDTLTRCVGFDLRCWFTLWRVFSCSLANVLGTGSNEWILSSDAGGARANSRNSRVDSPSFAPTSRISDGVKPTARNWLI